jgi:hypothetical protein
MRTWIDLDDDISEILRNVFEDISQSRAFKVDSRQLVPTNISISSQSCDGLRKGMKIHATSGTIT